MLKRTMVMTTVLIVSILAIGVCSPEGEEPVQRTLPVTASGEGIEAVVNAEGWTVTLSTFRLAISDIEFTIEGDTHASREPSLFERIVPRAMAHPGHYAGGDVTGELLGNFLLDLLSGEQSLGEATLLTEDYNGMNLHFRTADGSDGLASDDPLNGHTAEIAGAATSGVRTIHFTAILDVAAGTEMVGGPFELVLTEETEGILVLRALTRDPFEGDTLFDGIDFGALDEDADDTVQIAPGSAAHNVLVKTLIRHDHYDVVFRNQ